MALEMDFSIQNEKLGQAIELLQLYSIDAWLIFVRETNLQPDPALDLVLGFDVTWVSAFLLCRTGERIAIVGRYDVENVRRVGGYSEVLGYDESIAPLLKSVLKRLNPEQIAVNYSEDDIAADGLSHGMWLLLNSILADTPYKHRLVTAAKIAAPLRGRKTSTEISRLRGAVKTTQDILQSLTPQLTIGQTAPEIYALALAEMAKRGVTPAWSPCPMVAPGPDAPVGHTAPEAKYLTRAGKLLHMDIGVKQEGYHSDMQRVWYFMAPDENSIPLEVQTGFNLVRKALLAAAAALKPGARGWEVDAASRQVFIDNGIPQYQHAVGHHLGRAVHDGATVLGPRWPKYGKTVEGIVEIGNVYTLELGFLLEGYGYLGLEEDVLVSETGLEWLSQPQTELWVIS
jgi:Xaa-Pro aminopeptidase